LTVDNQIDTTTGTVKAKAVFDNRDGALFPNQFVNIRLILQEKQNAIVIPAAALQTGTQGNFVYLLKEGQPPADLVEKKKDTDMPVPQLAENQSNYYVQAQTVNVELTEGSQVILNSGVKSGDQIVVDGQEKLKNGSKVFPRTAPAKTGASGATAELSAVGDAAGQPS
jgi:multidrug efflux system membrane fusion protein